MTGLTYQHFSSMIETLGHRMGISFDMLFLHELFRVFGGHPYFAREFCSLVASRESERPLRMMIHHLQEYYNAFLLEKSGLFEQVIQYFEHFYPQEHAALVDIVNGTRVAEDSRLKHLMDYGLVAKKSNDCMIQIDCMRRWLEDTSNKTSLSGTAIAGRYSIVNELGTGASGKVFLVIDDVVQEQRALKQYVPGVSLDAVKTEMAVMKEMRSECTVQSYDVVPDEDGRFCLVMEYVEGRSLHDALLDLAPLPEAGLKRLAYRLLEALESIHPREAELKKGIESGDITESDLAEYFRLRDDGHLHRDIKPRNIIVTDERLWTVKIIDFGLATRAAFANKSIVGTRGYMAPDIGTVQWNLTFDLYACGVILFQAITGASEAVIHGAHGSLLDADVEPPASWGPFFRRALAHASGERFQSASEMRRGFDKVLGIGEGQ